MDREQADEIPRKLVRLTGCVMLDTAHVHHSHLLPGERSIGPVNRATDWEIHPVTKFEVWIDDRALPCRRWVEIGRLGRSESQGVLQQKGRHDSR